LGCFTRGVFSVAVGVSAGSSAGVSAGVSVAVANGSAAASVEGVALHDHFPGRRRQYPTHLLQALFSEQVTDLFRCLTYLEMNITQVHWNGLMPM